MPEPESLAGLSGGHDQFFNVFEKRIPQPGETMLKLLKAAACVVAVLGLSASSAGAANWQSNGPVNFTATVAPVSGGSANNSVFRDGAVTLGCKTTSATGTLAASPAAGTNPWPNAARIILVLNGCDEAGVPFSLVCAAASVNAHSYSGSIVAPFFGGVVFADIGGGTAISCNLTIGGVTCARITGNAQLTYTDPTATAAGFYTLKASGQSMTATSTCPGIPSGAIQLTDPSGGDLKFFVANPGAPSSQPRIAFA